MLKSLLKKDLKLSKYQANNINNKINKLILKEKIYNICKKIQEISKKLKSTETEIYKTFPNELLRTFFIMNTPNQYELGVTNKINSINISIHWY